MWEKFATCIAHVTRRMRSGCKRIVLSTGERHNSTIQTVEGSSCETTVQGQKPRSQGHSKYQHQTRYNSATGGQINFKMVEIVNTGAQHLTYF